jgi:hypothetical protein
VGRDWIKDWRRMRGRREASVVAHGHPWPLNPFVVSSRGTILISWISHPRIWSIVFDARIESFLLVVVPSYVGKLKKFLPSSITQQPHRLSLDPSFWNVYKKEFIWNQAMNGWEVEVKKVWIFNFFATEALNLRAKTFTSILCFILIFLFL